MSQPLSWWFMGTIKIRGENMDGGLGGPVGQLSWWQVISIAFL